MSLKDSPIVAVIIFKDGNRRHFYGDKYEKENCNVMVYLLRKMALKMLQDIKGIQMYDNRILDGDRLIFEYQQGVTLKNNLKNYLGENYDPK
jgi:hypothetical protein